MFAHRCIYHSIYTLICSMENLAIEENFLISSDEKIVSLEN